MTQKSGDIKPFEFLNDNMSVSDMDKDLLSILACPKCKGDVNRNRDFLVCNKCKLAFPVLEGDVPDMVIEDAWKLEKAKRAGFKHKLRL